MSACEQCGRTRLPLIDSPISLKDWFGSKPDDIGAELILKPGAPVSLAGVEEPTTKVCLLIGPEGGFSTSELDKILKLPISVPVSLGPRILRAETAAVAALTCFQAMTGDWSA